MPSTLIDRPSPNFGPRRAEAPRITMLVLHYTGMPSASDALARLCDPATAVSAHYLVDEDGTTYRLVAEDKRAWHAGVSFWRGVRDVNSASIGIELVNPGHAFGYREFPAAQIDTLASLAGDIVRRHGIAPWNVAGHSDIAPGRKQDPGELFPWAALAARGVGLWPSPGAPLIDPGALFKSLSAIGYAVPGGAGADILPSTEPGAAVIAAFQARFRPVRADGVADAETRAQIAAVLAEIGRGSSVV
ncbi:MAG: N-acetylmuramoyl-L-alanine amidase [Rhodospirillaceae bacterium]|nr:N-acetylmuramoyl-L-alanine amidase [Rhodospirillaceae bacterium]